MTSNKAAANKTLVPPVKRKRGRPPKSAQAASAAASASSVPSTIESAVSAPPAGTAESHAARLHAVGEIKSQSGVELTEKVKDLIRLAQEQGYLTYGDINDALPENVVMPEELEDIYTRLRNLEIEIVDQAEVDRVKQPEREEEDDKARLDILDDPVRMYLKQMGQVPLLTREQEVEISKRIEDAENEVKRIIYSFGFAGKEHIALAEKLVSEPPKERFDRVIVDKKIDSRDHHLKDLRKLVKQVRTTDLQVDDKYAELQRAAATEKRDKSFQEFKKLDKKLQASFTKFFYKQKVIEEMALVAENIHDKIQMSLHTIQECNEQRKSPSLQGIVQSEERKIKALEEFVRMSVRRVPEGVPRVEAFLGQGTQGQDRNGRGQPAPGHLDRQEIHQPRLVVPGSDPGRQHGADESRGEIRVSPRLQVFHLRHLVDSPGHHPFHR